MYQERLSRRHLVAARCSFLQCVLLLALMAPLFIAGIGEGAKKPERLVAITFDDGPTPQYTLPILNTLRNEQVPATFFVLGRQVELHPEIMQLAATQGHQIALHGYSHTNVTELSSQALRAELDKTAALISRTGVQYRPYFRPPRGIKTDKEMRTIERAGYAVVMWTFGIESSVAPTPEQMVDRLLQRLGDRRTAVLLMHDGFDLDRNTTVQALPLAIKRLREAGFTFVPLEQVLGEAIRHPQPARFGATGLRAKWPFRNN